MATRSSKKSANKLIWKKIPQAPIEYWLGQHLMSGIIIHSWDKIKGQPTKIKLDTVKVKDLKSGCGCFPAALEVEVSWTK